MIFTVLYSQAAQNRLIELCVAHFSTDLAAITAAANAIDAKLRHDPQSQGEISFDTVRTWTVAPLTVDFEVDEDNCKVHVIAVTYSE
jgi:hypothetical protein